jgi:hypothetical protein
MEFPSVIPSVNPLVIKKLLPRDIPTKWSG